MRDRAWLAVGFVVLGFLAVVILRDQPPADPTTDVPERVRLADLIERESSRTERLRAETSVLRKAVDDVQSGATDVSDVHDQIEAARARAGLAPVTGDGIVVTLRDSSLERAPSGNRNDLLIHSGDVHAVVNGLWSAGAEAVSVNGERVVATSALLCVGNTLLINGTVHSPPYEFTAIGPPDLLEERFEDDDLVQRLRRDAEAFQLGFDVEKAANLEAPPFEGALTVEHATQR